MGLAISLIVTVLEILNGFLNTDKELIKMAKTFNANKLQVLIKIVIPANINTFFNSLKVNIGLSLVGVITGEFLVSKAGLRILNRIWWAGISIRLSNDRSHYFSSSCSSHL
jgi:NitT/TauT family transport system permease protein